MTIATRHRGGLMGMEHARKLDKIKADILLSDPAAYGDIAPTLDLDFTNIYGAPFSGNFSRATIGGYRVNAKGVLVPTVANEPNIDFGSDGKPLGTGFYGAYTNLALRSEEFENATWIKTNVTVTANSTVGPDGTATMDTLNATVASGAVARAIAITAGTTAVHTFSVFLKQGTAAVTRISVAFYNGGATNYAIADLTWATKTVATSGAANAISALLEDVGGGIYRLSISGSNSGGANASLNIEIDPAGNGATGSVVAGLASLTATAFPVPYVPTTSVAVTRNADSMTISGTDFTDFFNPVEGTLFVEARAPIGATTFPLLASLDDGTDNNRYIFNYIGSSSNISCSTEVGGVTQASASFAVAPGASFKIAQSYKSNAFLAAISGMAFLTDTSGSLPSGLNRLAVGTGFNSTVTWWGEHIRRVIYWPKALSALDLKRITA